MNNISVIASTILYIGLLLLFINIYFFTVMPGIEKNIIEANIKHLLPYDISSTFNIDKKLFDRKDDDNGEAEQQKIDDNNNQLILLAIKIYGSICVGLFVLFVVLYIIYKFDLIPVLKHAGILAIFSIVVYVLFSIFIPSQFILLDRFEILKAISQN